MKDSSTKEPADMSTKKGKNWVLVILLIVSVVATLIYLFILKGFSAPIGAFLFPNQTEVTSSGERINVLVLGKGGEGHAGRDLTDTMMFVSIPLNVGKSIVTVSIPRDIWVSETRAKINSSYYWGNQKEAGSGLALASDSVSDVLGEEIGYTLALDFSSFERIVDALGGIEVDVATGFTDEKYPITGLEDDECDGDIEFKCRYQTIEFKTGLQEMDGATALAFSRSRSSVGDEGTDIARGARQQKVISSIIKKALSPKTLLNPKKIMLLYSVTLESVETNMGIVDGAVIFRKVLDSRDHLVQQTIPEELIVNPPISPRYDNQYVFVPKGGTWEEVHKWIDGILGN